MVSSQGRGLFNCLTGERLARDQQPVGTWYDEKQLLARGIGILDKQTIRLAGLYGGGLPTTTEDCWSLNLIAPTWPDYRVILSPPFKTIYDDLDVCVQVFQDYEIRAYGFSNTGKSFVIATSSDITMFKRDAI